MSALPQRRFYTEEEYFHLEQSSQERYEYYHGQVFMMAGASPNHSRIQRNAMALLFAKLRGSSCEVHGSELRVGVPFKDVYTYPDVLVVCGEPEYAPKPKYTLLNPTLIIEVLSPSTEAHDMNEKFAVYRQLKSFNEYVLISQDKVRVMHYRKAGDGWLLHIHEDSENTLTLELHNLFLPIHELYVDVRFDDEASAEKTSLPHTQTPKKN